MAYKLTELLEFFAKEPAAALYLVEGSPPALAIEGRHYGGNCRRDPKTPSCFFVTAESPNLGRENFYAIMEDVKTTNFSEYIEKFGEYVEYKKHGFF